MCTRGSAGNLGSDVCFRPLTPPIQVHSARARLSTPPDRIEGKTVPGGHVGLFMSHRTVGDTWPGIAGWIRHNDSTTEGQ